MNAYNPARLAFILLISFTHSPQAISYIRSLNLA
jgi:hypothetical protein